MKCFHFLLFSIYIVSTFAQFDDNTQNVTVEDNGVVDNNVVVFDDKGQHLNGTDDKGNHLNGCHDIFDNNGHHVGSYDDYGLDITSYDDKGRHFNCTGGLYTVSDSHINYVSITMYLVTLFATML